MSVRKKDKSFPFFKLSIGSKKDFEDDSVSLDDGGSIKEYNSDEESKKSDKKDKKEKKLKLSNLFGRRQSSDNIHQNGVGRSPPDLPSPPLPNNSTSSLSIPSTSPTVSTSRPSTLHQHMEMRQTTLKEEEEGKGEEEEEKEEKEKEKEEKEKEKEKEKEEKEEEEEEDSDTDDDNHDDSDSNPTSQEHELEEEQQWARQQAVSTIIPQTTGALPKDQQYQPSLQFKEEKEAYQQTVAEQTQAVVTQVQQSEQDSMRALAEATAQVVARGGQTEAKEAALQSVDIAKPQTIISEERVHAPSPVPVCNSSPIPITPTSSSSRTSTTHKGDEEAPTLEIQAAAIITSPVSTNITKKMRRNTIQSSLSLTPPASPQREVGPVTDFVRLTPTTEPEPMEAPVVAATAQAKTQLPSVAQQPQQPQQPQISRIAPRRPRSELEMLRGNKRASSSSALLGGQPRSTPPSSFKEYASSTTTTTITVTETSLAINNGTGNISKLASPNSRIGLKQPSRTLPIPSNASTNLPSSSFSSVTATAQTPLQPLALTQLQNSPAMIPSASTMRGDPLAHQKSRMRYRVQSTPGIPSVAIPSTGASKVRGPNTPSTPNTLPSPSQLFFQQQAPSSRPSTLYDPATTTNATPSSSRPSSLYGTPSSRPTSLHGRDPRATPNSDETELESDSRLLRRDSSDSTVSRSSTPAAADSATTMNESALPSAPVFNLGSSGPSVSTAISAGLKKPAAIASRKRFPPGALRAPSLRVSPSAVTSSGVRTPPASRRASSPATKMPEKNDEKAEQQQLQQQQQQQQLQQQQQQQLLLLQQQQQQQQQLQLQLLQQQQQQQQQQQLIDAQAQAHAAAEAAVRLARETEEAARRERELEAQWIEAERAETARQREMEAAWLEAEKEEAMREAARREQQLRREHLEMIEKIMKEAKEKERKAWEEVERLRKEMDEKSHAWIELEEERGVTQALVDKTDTQEKQIIILTAGLDELTEMNRDLSRRLEAAERQSELDKERLTQARAIAATQLVVPLHVSQDDSDDQRHRDEIEFLTATVDQLADERTELLTKLAEEKAKSELAVNDVNSVLEKLKADLYARLAEEKAKSELAANDVNNVLEKLKNANDLVRNLTEENENLREEIERRDNSVREEDEYYRAQLDEKQSEIDQAKFQLMQANEQNRVLQSTLEQLMKVNSMNNANIGSNTNILSPAAPVPIPDSFENLEGRRYSRRDSIYSSPATPPTIHSRSMSFSEKPQISLFTNGFAEEYPPYQQQPPSPSSASMQPQTPTTPTRQHRPSLSSTTLFGRSNSLATDPTPGTPNSQTLFRQTPQDYPWYEGEATSPTTNTNGHRNSMARASSGSLRSSTGSAMGSNGIVASLISAYEGSTKRQEKQKQIDELDAELRAVTKEREQIQQDYSRLPISGGGPTSRRRREEIEEQLDEVDLRLSKIKLRMRSLGVN